MVDEVIRRDVNAITLLGAITNTTAQDIVQLRVDSITKRLLVDAELETTPGLAIPTHDYIALGYTGDNLTSVVYKIGGASGTTVATLTLAYTGSVLDSITKT